MSVTSADQRAGIQDDVISLRRASVTGVKDTVARIPGIGLMHADTIFGVPPVFTHLLTNLPAIYKIVVFVTVRQGTFPAACRSSELGLISVFSPTRYLLYAEKSSLALLTRKDYFDLFKCSPSLRSASGSIRLSWLRNLSFHIDEPANGREEESEMIPVMIREVPVPRVEQEERYLITELDYNGFYRCVCRYGYILWLSLLFIKVSMTYRVSTPLPLCEQLLTPAGLNVGAILGHVSISTKSKAHKLIQVLKKNSMWNSNEVSLRLAWWSLSKPFSAAATWSVWILGKPLKITWSLPSIGWPPLSQNGRASKKLSGTKLLARRY